MSLLSRSIASLLQSRGRSRIQRPVSPGRLNSHSWAASGCLQRLTKGWCTRQRPSLQSQVREDLLDHRLLKNRRDDLQLATAVRAALQVEIEHPPERLGQLRRTGRRCEQRASHSAGFASCAGASGSCGTTCGTTSPRNLALDAKVPCASIALCVAGRCVPAAAGPPTGTSVRRRLAASGRRDQDSGCLFTVEAGLPVPWTGRFRAVARQMLPAPGTMPERCRDSALWPSNFCTPPALCARCPGLRRTQ